MNLSDKEAQLFEEWKGSREGFVYDGVVAENDYINSEIKLCFVLKEVNDPDGGGWDLRKFIYNGARRQTWDNISRWVHCIRNMKTTVKWSEIDRIDEDFRKNILRSISAMNLKKSPGGHTTERASFDMVVSEDKYYIQRQYDMYSPDITICCGTGGHFRAALNLNDGEVFETSRGIKWFSNKSDKPVIIYPHPEARVQDSLLVYGLVDAIQEIHT